jgi:carbamate kinase
LINKLRAENSPRYTITLLTQVVVDENDPAFQNPTKPIGPFYSQEEAEALMKQKSWSMVEDSGRGWRRVVPSPLPQKIVQRKMINDFVRRGHIVIALGGGGIPVIKDPNSNYVGVEAVIDKDLASCELACTVKADLLIILTEVEKVFLNFNKPDQQSLDEISIDEAKQYLDQKHFPAGSMGPKIQAAIKFVEKTGKDVLITSITKLQEGLAGTTGTRITKERKITNYQQAV